MTASRAFSVALGSRDRRDSGVLIFGGVDVRKFRGRLHREQMLPPPQGRDPLARYYAAVDSLGLTRPGQEAATSAAYAASGLAAVLDTGATLTYLPAPLVRQVAADVGAFLAADGVSYLVPCDVGAQAGGSLDFNFNKTSIRVPFSELVWESEPGTCVLGVQSSEGLGIDALLGDTFMRSAYVVFDQDSSAIFLAPYQDCGSKEVTIPTEYLAAGNITGECSLSPSAGVRIVGGSMTATWVGVAVAVAVQVFLGRF